MYQAFKEQQATVNAMAVRMLPTVSQESAAEAYKKRIRIDTKAYLAVTQEIKFRPWMIQIQTRQKNKGIERVSIQLRSLHS
jgi:hypothetical protein